MHKRKWLHFTALLIGCVVAVSNPYNVLSAPSQGEVQEVSNTKAKNYGVVNVNTNLNVRQDKGIESEIVATLPDRAVCYIQSAEDGWAYVKSGEVYGYVSEEYLYVDDKAWRIVHSMGEENMAVACWVEPETDEYVQETEEDVNESLAATVPAYTLDNIEMRQEIVSFAEQFLGNPYVWGGTSLTNGTDCSGFVQSVYAQFGIELPRVSQEQADVGMKIPVADAQAGDLIFYERDGEIYHVVMYIGDGQVIHASSSATGIKISRVFYENAVYAITVL